MANKKALQREMKLVARMVALNIESIVVQRDEKGNYVGAIITKKDDASK
ncbi:MAG: hypothetical protein NT155_03635 [Candidatus Staskawiczbacteria bacterium]|nr:hypothetical protein [Candidatus Staskawiczbacteria bacterium]